MLRLACCLLLTLLLTVPSPGQITLSDEDVFVDEPVTVTLAAPAEALTVTYRPNSSIARSVTIPTHGTREVTWTPEQAGVVALSAPESGMRNVSVRYRHVPAAGIVVLFIAGCLLFGGAIFAFRKLFQDGPAPVKPSRRPDT